MTSNVLKKCKVCGCKLDETNLCKNCNLCKDDCKCDEIKDDCKSCQFKSDCCK